MKIITPSVEICLPMSGAEMLRHVERCGRVCYKSEAKITDTSAEAFVRGLIKRGHEAVLVFRYGNRPVKRQRMPAQLWLFPAAGTGGAAQQSQN